MRDRIGLAQREEAIEAIAPEPPVHQAPQAEDEEEDGLIRSADSSDGGGEFEGVRNRDSIDELKNRFSDKKDSFSL